MNIDERIERLTERHEALAQSLELLVSLHRDHEARFIENEARSAKMDGRLDKLLAAVEALTRIAEQHERRISGLEEDK